MDTDSTDVVRRFYEAWSMQDLDAASGLVTEDFVNNSSTSQGREGVVEEGRFWFTAFPDARASVEDLIADGDKVVARLHATATHLGEFLGIAPTGRTIELDEIDIFRIEGGAIAEAWSVPDLFGLMNQLGAFEQASADEHAGVA